MASRPHCRFALVALIALFAVMFSPQARATTYTAPTFTLKVAPSGTTNPPGFVVTEGDSLDLKFLVNYTGTGTPRFDIGSFALNVVSGDPLDQFMGIEVSQLPNGAPTLVQFFTNADFNGDSGLNQVSFKVTDLNAQNSSVTVAFDATIVDPRKIHRGPTASASLDPPTTTPLPAALPLFATGLGALGLLGWRRKRNHWRRI